MGSSNFGKASHQTFKSPIARVGGKYALAKQLIQLFPEHTTYVEVFGGAAHVLFRKEPSPVEIYNDIDALLVNFFRVMADAEQCGGLCRRVYNALYSRDEFNRCLRDREDGSDLDKAVRFAVINKQSFGGMMGTWGVDIKEDHQTKGFTNMPARIQNAHLRMKSVQIECQSFEGILRRYDTPDTFFYLDPPYPFTAERSSRKVYEYEMTNDDHVRLVDMLLNIQGKAMLSGYDTPLYAPLELAGWEKIQIGERNIAINLKKDSAPRIRKNEYVWVNY